MYRITTVNKVARRQRLARNADKKVRKNTRRTNCRHHSPLAGVTRHRRTVNYATVHYPHSLAAHLDECDWDGPETEDTHAGEFDDFDHGHVACIYGNPYCETCV
jgi:hypothetical protein